MEFTIIVAVASNGVIGNNGKIPWTSITEDMKRFRNLTLEHACVMGRVTYESILNCLKRPLDKRMNIVVTERGGLQQREGVVFCKGIFEALEEAERYNPNEPAYIIGGTRIYAQTISLPQVTRMEITHIKRPYEGDVHFPYLFNSVWKETRRVEREDYDFVTYERR